MRLRHAVVGHGAEFCDRNVGMLVARLRRKIELNAQAPAFILTVPRLGYKFTAGPQSAEDGKLPSSIDLEQPTEARASGVDQSVLDVVMPTSAPDQAASLHSESSMVAARGARVIENANVPKYHKGNYLLISPCRDEARYMRETLDSVISQSVRPAKWIIVDDGSTDSTPQILAEYRAKHDWIEVVTRSDRGQRSVGPGVIEAFYAGYNAINPDDYDYLCKLDLDLHLPPRYFEILMQRMTANPRIATCSGKAYVDENGKLVEERHGDDTSLGMTKFYRVSCFKGIGGFVREVMWDGIDCHRCRMNGWIACSWDEPELRFVHLRPMGSSQQSIFTGRVRHGYGQYFMGTGFLYIAASAISRISQKPYVLGSVAMLWGWLKSAIDRKPRYHDAEFHAFLRRYQRRVLLVGKNRAIEEIRGRINQNQ